jgi:hypothetical protein
MDQAQWRLMQLVVGIHCLKQRNNDVEQIGFAYIVVAQDI